MHLTKSVKRTLKQRVVSVHGYREIVCNVSETERSVRCGLPRVDSGREAGESAFIEEYSDWRLLQSTLVDTERCLGVLPSWPNMPACHSDTAHTVISVIQEIKMQDRHTDKMRSDHPKNDFQLLQQGYHQLYEVFLLLTIRQVFKKQSILRCTALSTPG